jgi:hypothetical protein
VKNLTPNLDKLEALPPPWHEIRVQFIVDRCVVGDTRRYSNIRARQIVEGDSPVLTPAEFEEFMKMVVFGYQTLQELGESLKPVDETTLAGGPWRINE